MNDTQLVLFYYDYREWWAIFKFSEYSIIRELSLTLRKLCDTDTLEKQAVLMSLLNAEFNRMAKERTVYEKKVVVKESDEDSVIRALQTWGLNDEKLLRAARAVYRVWDGVYSNEDVVWPREGGNSTEPSKC